MPTNRGNDSIGSFYRWGNSGKKYYYTTGNKEERNKAKQKAHKQGVAINVSNNVKKNKNKFDL